MAPAQASDHQVVPALWNPSAAANWSLLLSPTFGAILIRANLKALGQNQDARVAERWAVASATLIVASPFFPESDTGRAAMAVMSLALLLLWYYSSARPHIQDVQRRFGRGYPRRTWGKPLSFAVLMLLIVGGLIERLVPGGGRSQAQYLRFENDPLSRAFVPLTPGELPDALRALSNADTNVAYVAAFRLHRMGPPAVAPLQNSLTDANPQVRLWAACALGMSGQAASNAAPALKPLLGDANEDVRVAAGFALARMHSNDAFVQREIAQMMGKPNSPILEFFPFVQHESTPGAPICTMEGNSLLLSGGAGVENTNSDVGIMTDGIHPDAKTFFEFVVRQTIRDFAKSLDAQTAAPADLVASLDDPKTGLSAVSSLCRMGPRAIEPVTAALTNSNAQVRERAAFVLGCLGHSANAKIPELTALLQREPPSQNGHCRGCGAAAFALGRMMPESQSALLGLLRGDSPTAARYAAAQLGRFPRPQVIAALIDALADPREHVWVAAAFALGKVGAPAADALGALRRQLGRDDPVGALTVAVALEQIAPEATEAEPVMLDMLANDEPEIRKAAVAAVGALLERPAGGTGRGSGPPPGPVLARSRQLSRVIEKVVSLARDDDSEVRLEVMRCLGFVVEPSDSVLNVLEQALGDDDRSVENQAALALAKHGVSAIPHFEAALRHKSPTVRRWAAFGLGEVTATDAQQEVVGVLTNALTDKHPMVRKAAVASLERTANRGSFAQGAGATLAAELVVPALTRQLTDPDPETRLEVALALAGLKVKDDALRRVLVEAEHVRELPRGTRERIAAALRQSQ
jgi:HEAT repeat protein